MSLSLSLFMAVLLSLTMSTATRAWTIPASPRRPSAVTKNPTPTMSRAPSRSLLMMITAAATNTKKALSEIDEMCLENVADFCLNMTECDVEEYEALVNTLERQHDLLMERVAKLEDILRQLHKRTDHVARTDDPAAVQAMQQHQARITHMMQSVQRLLHME